MPISTLEHTVMKLYLEDFHTFSLSLGPGTAEVRTSADQCFDPTTRTLVQAHPPEARSARRWLLSLLVLAFAHCRS